MTTLRALRARPARARRHGSSSCASQLALVFVGHHQPQAGEQRHHVDREGDEEGIAPAPVQEVGRRQVGPQVGEQRRRRRGSRAARPAGPASRTSRGGPAGAFSASSDGRPSQEPPSARPWPMRHSASSAIGGHARAARSPAGRRCPRWSCPAGTARPSAWRSRLKRRWIAMPTSVPIGRATKASAEQREGVQRALQPVGEREEHRREHQHRGDAVDEEVEVFRGAADHHADGDFARGDACASSGGVVGGGAVGAGQGSGVGKCRVDDGHERSHGYS